MRIELPVFSFLCVVPLLLLAPLHYKSRNIAMLSLVGWLAICNLAQGINSIVWQGHTEIRAQVWCDIGEQSPFFEVLGFWLSSVPLCLCSSVTKFFIASHIALPAICTCICRYLAIISSRGDPTQRPRRILFDCSLCIGLPVFFMVFRRSFFLKRVKQAS